MNPVDLKSNTYFESGKEKDQWKRSVILLEHQIQKYICKMLHSKLIWKGFCDLKKLKIL